LEARTDYRVLIDLHQICDLFFLLHRIDKGFLVLIGLFFSTEQQLVRLILSAKISQPFNSVFSHNKSASTRISQPETIQQTWPKFTQGAAGLCSFPAATVLHKDKRWSINP
jgi:hypothetical protein